MEFGEWLCSQVLKAVLHFLLSDHTLFRFRFIIILSHGDSLPVHKTSGIVSLEIFNPIVARYATPGLFDPVMLESSNYLFTEETEFPAGGAIGTVSDLFRFTEMLRRRGELDGIRILSPTIIKTATTNQTGTLPNDILDYAREMRGWPEWPAYIGLDF